jgi:hypothetical protein
MHASLRSLMVVMGVSLVACASEQAGVVVGGGAGDAGARTDTSTARDVPAGATDTGAAMDATASDAGAATDGAAMASDAAGPGADSATDGGSTATGDGAATGSDGGGPAADGGGFAGGCGTREVCGDGLDNDCDGTADEGCPCIPGQTQRCYDGPPAQAGRGVCVYGMQRCEGSGEFGQWSACAGAGRPRAVTCMGTDDRCTGVVDEGCGCPLGLRQPCYSGPAGTRDVGACRAGTRLCEARPGGGSAWSACEGEVLPRPNRCDGVDLACTGDPASGCACTVGATEACYSGPMGTAGVGTCRAGSRSCVRDGDGVVAWGPCTGEVLPAANRCDGVDRGCTGDATRGCVCTEGQRRACYDGPAGTEGVGLCRPGMQTCVRGEGDATAWGACGGATVPRTEVCNNGFDDNCNGMVDEGCAPCFAASTTPWQSHRVMGPICFGRTFSTHGDPAMYAFAQIPGETDPGWSSVTAPTVEFAETSSLCGRSCTCLNGGEFTYFQTFFTVPDSYRVDSMNVTVGSVDDGVRITVFNSRYPSGVVDAGSYAYLGGGSTTDLARYIAPGRNRIVLTHLDDCCSHRSVGGVRVVINGANLATCQP